MIGKKKVKVGSKVYTYPRDYVKEYAKRSDRQKDNRTIRRQARTKVEKIVGKSRISGKDIDHIHGVGKGNSLKNLRVTSVKANRSRKSLRWR